MKKILSAAVALLVLASCMNVRVNNSKKDNSQAQQSRSLKGFERIELLGALDVDYMQADSFSVQVKAPDEVIQHVETRVEGNRLIINMKGEGKLINFGIADSDDVKVYVTSPDLVGIELRGSGDFDCKRHLDTDNLDIQLKGSGDIEFDDIICDRINVSVVGSGDVDVKHIITQQASLELVGSGDIEMGFDKSGDVKTTLTGSGELKLRGVVNRLNNSVRGSGSVDTRHLTINQPS